VKNISRLWAVYFFGADVLADQKKKIRNWAAHKLKFCGHLEANSGNPQAEADMAIGHCCPGNVDFGIWQSKLSNQVKST
jgi:hypothetical protein